MTLDYEPGNRSASADVLVVVLGGSFAAASLLDTVLLPSLISLATHWLLYRLPKNDSPLMANRATVTAATTTSTTTVLLKSCSSGYR
jgi:hypothetical protein